MIAYAITDRFANFQWIAQKANWIVYRDKTTPHYAHNAQRFLQESRNYPLDKVLLHGDYPLAYQLGAKGVHLTSSQIQHIPKAKALGLFVIASTHTQQEALQAQKLGVDTLTYSPIFDTPNKGKPIGLEALQELRSLIDTPIIALGGIVTQEQIEACILHGANGFASIRYFAPS